MKRFIFYLTVILVLSASCRKEEIFNPSRKIEYIKVQMPSQMQQWAFFKYDKNTLVALSVTDPKAETGPHEYMFEYNRDKQIIVISDLLSNERAELTYEDKLLKEVKFYVDNQLSSTIEVSHKKDKICKLDYISVSSHASSLCNIICPEQKNTQGLKTRKDNRLYMRQYITYNGDNVSRMRTYLFNSSKDSSLLCSYSYTYDNSRNPFYGLPLPLFDVKGYSKNNVATTQISYDNGYENYDRALISQRNTYTCKKQYPIDHQMIQYITVSDVEQIYNQEKQTYYDTIIIRYSGVDAQEYYVYDYAK